MVPPLSLELRSRAACWKASWELAGC